MKNKVKPPADSLEFIRLLNANHVKYLVVGGYAVAWHGYPRFTGDIDFFVECSPANAAALVKTVDEFGFGSMGLTVNDFMEVGIVIQLGRPPFRIDILTFADGLTFSQAWQTRISAELDGTPAHMISKELLIANKLASGRDQDKADAAKLTE